MFGQRVTLFTLLGIEVRANTSWVLLAVLVFWSLATGLFPAQLPGLSVPAYWALALLGTIGVFFSLLFHEFSHALVARRHGMQIDGITLFLFGGVAEITEEPASPRIEVRMAAAGPIASGVLFLVFSLLATLVGLLPAAEPVASVLGYLALINLILAIFNLFPGFPLDGGRMLRGWLWHRRGNLLSATRTASRMGQAFGLTLLILGFWSLLSVGALGGLWWILIGIFVMGLARAAYDQTAARLAFEGTPIERFMVAGPISVTPELTLDDFVRDYAYRHHYSVFPVTERGQLVGQVRTRAVRDVDQDDWPHTKVSDIMRSFSDEQLAAPEDDADQVLRKMQQSQSGQIIVADGNQLKGIVTLRDLLEYLSLREDLTGKG